jgi:hypothetical protein
LDGAGNEANQTRIVNIISPESLVDGLDIIESKCGSWNNISFENSYTLNNNDWGKSRLLENQEYKQCIFSFNDENSLKGGWLWGWPNGEGGVKSYPEAIYGKKFRGQVNLEGVLPKQVKELSSVNIGLTYHDFNITGSYNIALESWLHTTDDSSMDDIRYEIMVRFDPNGFYPSDRLLFSEDALIDGVHYRVFKKQERGNPNRYFYNFVAKEKITNIDFDFVKILDYLKTNDTETCSDMDELYYNDVEMGVEVINGRGVVVLDRFEINVKDNNASTKVKTAVLYDSIVANARYDAGSGITGYTDENGTFKYIEGQNIKFYVNDIFIGEGQPIDKPEGISVVADKILTPLELAGAGDDIGDAKVLKIVRFLMALDRDGNPNNGLDINESKIFRYNLNLLDDDVNLSTTFNNGLEFPSSLIAKEHLCQSLHRYDCIQEKQDIAYLFGVATQGTDSSYNYYSPASNAIDHNDSTYNHTRGGANGENWIQIELPNPTKIHRIVIQNRGSFAERLENAKVYISDSNYTGEVNSSNLVATLQPTENEQIITFDTPRVGHFLLIKGETDSNDDKHLHLRKVEVYGEVPIIANYIAKFPKEKYDFGLEINTPIKTIVGRVLALNYAYKSLTYSIIGDVPFSINNEGEIRLTSLINHNQTQSFNFQVEVNDGLHTNRADVTVNLLSNNGVKEERWNSIDGGSVSNFLNSSHYQNDAPDEVKIVEDLNMNESMADNFGQIMSAILKPSISGEYIFAIVGDDGTQLNLNGKEIASKSGWSSYQEWDSAGVSSSIVLNAGEIYAIDAILKEWGGAEHISVGWKMVGEDTFRPIPKSELFIEKLDSQNIKPQFNPHSTLFEIQSANAIGDKVATVGAFDSQGDTLSYRIVDNVPFAIDNNGVITINNSLEVKTYTFEVEVSDGISTTTTTVNIQSNTDTHALNDTKEDFETKAKAFTSDGNLGELIESYLDYTHIKSKDIYVNFMQTPLDDDVWSWIENDHYLKEGLYASRFPANPHSVKNLADFKAKFRQENNASLVDEYKNVILGLAINAKERGIEEEAFYGDTWEHRTIDYERLAQYEEKERIWRDEYIIKDLGYGIGYFDFKNYLTIKYDLSVSEADELWGLGSILKRMANDGEDILSVDYDTRKSYGLSFDGINLYRLSKGLSRLSCTDTDNPCTRIQNWLDNNGTITKSELLANFKSYKSNIEGLINPRDNMANELSELMGVAPDKYRLMSFYDLAKWKISLDNISPIDFNDDEPNWPIFDASLKYNATSNAYPWQLATLEQSAQKQECGYVKSRFFETDKQKLIDSYPPNAVDGGAKKERRFIEYTNYTWAYDAPEVWFRESEWSPHRTVYRILQDGGVCGRQSTMGQHVNECLNRPSIGIGQPGHRAWIGVYNHATIANQYYVKIGYQVGSKESAGTGIDSIYDRYTKGIRDRGMERFGGVVTGVSPAGVGEHIFNQSMILQHIGKILENQGESPEIVLQKAVEIAPTNVDAWYQLARYYASQDEPQKVIDLANEFMNRRNSFFLDDDTQKGGENLEIIVGKIIAFIALEAPSIQEGRGEEAQAFKDKLWDYLDTYEVNYRSYRSYGYQNRYLAQLYLVRNEDNDGFINEVETLFDRFLENTTSGWYPDNYFKNVYWGDVNKTALFDSLQLKTDEAQISDNRRAKIYEKILGRGQGVELANITVNDLCTDSNLSKCQSLKSFELDAQEVYILTSNNVVGEDTEVDPTKQGEEGYSTLVIPVIDNTGKELDIKVRIAKLATGDIDGKLLKINDPTAVTTTTTKIVAWIDSSDNQLEANRIYTARYRIVLKVKKRVTNNEEYMGNIILNIQNLMLGESLTITAERWSGHKFDDDSTSVYFVALDPEVAPTTGVWFGNGYTSVKIKVQDSSGNIKTLTLRGTNNGYTMNSAENADWDNALVLEYHSEDNEELISGEAYKSIAPITIDAKMWHKNRELKERMYIGVDMVVP